MTKSMTIKINHIGQNETRSLKTNYVIVYCLHLPPL